ncbi:ead/Ea22-like family protein [Escherichia coli]|nr:ead/Ea22-like family protein [Escherichia coli]
MSKIDYQALREAAEKATCGEWSHDRLIITKGYPKRDDSSRRIDVPYDGYEIKTITHPHFGDKPVKVFAIKVNIDD